MKTCLNCNQEITEENEELACEECGTDGCEKCMPTGFCDNCEEAMSEDEEDL